MSTDLFLSCLSSESFSKSYISSVKPCMWSVVISVSTANIEEPYLHDPALHLLGAAAPVAAAHRADLADVELILAENVQQLEPELVDVLADLRHVVLRDAEIFSFLLLQHDVSVIRKNQSEVKFDLFGNIEDRTEHTIFAVHRVSQISPQDRRKSEQLINVQNENKLRSHEYQPKNIFMWLICIKLKFRLVMFKYTTLQTDLLSCLSFTS